MMSCGFATGRRVEPIFSFFGRVSTPRPTSLSILLFLANIEIHQCILCNCTIEPWSSYLVATRTCRARCLQEGGHSLRCDAKGDFASRTFAFTTVPTFIDFLTTSGLLPTSSSFSRSDKHHSALLTQYLHVFATRESVYTPAQLGSFATRS